MRSSKSGYKKPPKHSRFRKGNSGNPKGRPKGSRNFARVLDAELDKKITISENGVHRRVDTITAVIKRLVQQSLGGDQKATTTLLALKGRFSPPGESLPDVPVEPFELDLLRKYLPYLQGLVQSKGGGHDHQQTA